MTNEIGINDIVFNNNGIDTVSLIASYKTVLGMLERNGIELKENNKHTPINPYVSDLEKRLGGDEKKRYKKESFKPFVQYAKLSNGTGLSNYLIILRNTPTLFDYAIDNKKAKDFYCMVIFSGLHQPTKTITNDNLKLISKFVKRKCFKLYSVDIASDFNSPTQINYRAKDEVKTRLLSHTDPKGFYLLGSSLYCNRVNDKSISKLLLYDKFHKQKTHQKQPLNDDLNQWKRMEITIKPRAKTDFKSYVLSRDFRDVLGEFSTMGATLNPLQVSNGYLYLQLKALFDNRVLNGKQNKERFNTITNISRLKNVGFDEVVRR